MKDTFSIIACPLVALAMVFTTSLTSGCGSAPKRHATLDKEVCGKFVVSGHGQKKGDIKKGAVTFEWPVEGIFFSKFGPRRGRHHDGIDVSAPAGTPIKAAADGKVVFSGRFCGYGNMILLRHDNGYFTAYAHNRANLVDKGEKVAQGEVIAEVGRTGRTTGNHLHFEVRRGRKAMDPLSFLPVTDGVYVKKGMHVGGEQYAISSSKQGSQYANKDSPRARKSKKSGKVAKAAVVKIAPKATGRKK